MLYQQITRNKRKTVIVMFSFTLLLMAAGGGAGILFADDFWPGCWLTLVITLIYLAIVLPNPASMVMALNHAHEIHEKDNPTLWHIVEDMAMVARVPMPRVYVITDKSPNAFATGRDPQHASVAVTQGLLDQLDREELEGVLGHEISHVRNYDILLSTISLVMVGVITWLANFCSRWLFWGGSGRRSNNDRNDGGNVFEIIKLVLVIFTLILAPLAATLAQLALSRNREYLADASSVELTRNPQGLISALEKITKSQPMKEADPSSAAMYFTNPFKKRTRASWFDTHPSTPDRIARLKKM